MRLTTARAGMVILLPAAALSLASERASAQGRAAADLFLLQNDALAGSSPLYGAGFSTGGSIGLRVSGAAALSNATNSRGEDTYGIGSYSADADVVLSMVGLGGLTGAATSTAARAVGASPYIFAGVGVVGRRLTDGELTFDGSEWERGPSLSFGGGMALPLGDVLGVDASARYRVSFADSSQWVTSFPRGWEYRVGVRLHLGGARRSTATRTPTRTSRSGGRAEPAGVPFPIPVSTAGASAAGSRVVNTADQYLGVPYVWGGETPRGFDCSGFTQYVFRKNGIELPRTSRQQVQVGAKVAKSLSSLRTGDLIFFAENYSRVDHVAIYAGDGRIIHATSSGGEVRYDDLRSQRGAWFMDHMVAARRYTGNTSAWEGILSQLLTEAVKQYDKGDKAPRP